MIILALLTVGQMAIAQKIDQRLTRLVERTNTHSAQRQCPINPKAIKQKMAINFNADGTVSSMSAIATLKEGATCPTERLQQMGIKVRYVLGDMVVLNIPADKLLQLEQIEEFRYVKADEMNHPMNKQARKTTNVEKVNSVEAALAAGLPKAYTGAGVVLGIIDSGIDFNHAAFRNTTDGKTRIVKAITIIDNIKKVYNTEEEIAALTTDLPISHGTVTSTTAGGSDLGNGLQGMAPETDIILCGIGNYSFDSNIVECIKEIFDYATSVGKPAVVNLSIGQVLGLHDGSNITCKSISTLTENGTKPGRAVIISSSNDASNNQSIIKKFNSTDEELKTVLGANSHPTKSEPDQPVAYNTIYSAYADDYGMFSCKLKLVDTTNGKIIELGEHVRDVKTDEPIVNIDLEKDKIFEAITADGRKANIYEWELVGYKLDDPKYRFVLLVTPEKAGQTIKLICNGDGNKEPCFDAPNENGYNFAEAGYTKGNGDFAFSTNICSENVISVGSYVNRIDWIDHDGKEWEMGPSKLTGHVQTVGEIADYSSYGVADNGVTCPTVIAPGEGIISGASNYDTAKFFKVDEPGVPDPQKGLTELCPGVDKYGRKNWFLITGGTSMAAPAVAGIVALWMQANPQLTVKEIREIIKTTSINDEWTTDIGKIPSHNKLQAGYGKIDCLAGLKKILGISTGIETVGADGHREASPATMYSVDAPVYNMMGQRVDKSHRGLVIYKGRKYMNR